MLLYPSAPKSDQIDTYHGTSVPDPFRVLEDADDPRTREWVDRQNELTRSILDTVSGRDEDRQTLTRLWNYERFGNFHKAGPRYFCFHNSGLQNQSVLLTLNTLEATPRVLIDPNTLRSDGTAALNGISTSGNGQLMAYAVAQAGSDWNEWRIRNIETGEDLPDLIRWSKTGPPAWAPGDHGFFYSRFPEPAPEHLLTAISHHEKIYFHNLGDDQASDQLVYERPDQPHWLFTPIVMEGSKILLIYIHTGVWGSNRLSWLEVDSPAAPIKDLIAHDGSSYDPIAVLGTTLYLKTTDHAPRGRIITLDLHNPAPEHWREIIPEDEAILESAQIADGKLLLAYKKDAHSAARLTTLEGEPVADIEFSGLGTASWSPARLHDTEAFYSFTSYITPPSVYRLDLRTGLGSLLRKANCPFDSTAFETRQIFFASKDGTRVPMFVSARKGLEMDGNNPAVLYGYGGFDVALSPGFAPWIAAWLERGGIWTVVNLRGGSEYGDDWHKAGMKDRKQNVFDDFIAAAETLITTGYTSPRKLATFGGSNGGLLVAACLNQRPDLFGAVMPAVGVLDMLRFHKFGFGAQWTGEYGDPDNPADFAYLCRYSPLHTIHPGPYPPVLITTADHDDRVMPGHSLKYAATLQEAQSAPAPILLRVETRAGHGAGKPVSKSIEEWTDRLAFLRLALGV